VSNGFVRGTAFAAVVLTVACGPRDARVVTPPPDLDRAVGLIRQGCYDCLLEARTIYRQAAAAPSGLTAAPRLFEVNVLIALREKELALDGAEAFAEAEAVARRLPAEFDASHYLELVANVPLDDVGTPRSVLRAFTRARIDSGWVDRLDAELAWLRTGSFDGVFREYLSLALDCAYPRASAPGATARPSSGSIPGADAPPILRYRYATCRRIGQRVLTEVRDAEPRFVETSIPLTRLDLALAEQLGPGQASERLAEARARFPRSPSALYLSGSLHQLIGDCDTALAFYDQTLALQPLHEDALLGRVTCLSTLDQHADAIAAATRIIDLHLDNIADAYYWRAWNHDALHELPEARADVTEAKRVPTLVAFTLAGIIEHDQGDLGPAEIDLARGRTMARDDMNCIAIWYLGLVHMKRLAWPEGARDFEDAMPCYEKTAAQVASRLQQIQSQPGIDAAFVATRVAALRTEIQDDVSQRFAAALNAANCYATAGRVPETKRLVDIAAQDPALGEMVKKLRDWLRDKGGVTLVSARGLRAALQLTRARSSKRRMVEAAGVEPASERPVVQGRYMLSRA